VRLNDYAIKALPHKDARYDVWDDALPRFGIRVGARRKTFIVNIGRTRKSLGVYPHTTLKDARDKARQLLYSKYLPATSLKAQAAAEAYLRAIAAEKRPNTISAYTIYLKRLPNEPLHQLTAHKLYSVLPEGKGAANLCFNVFKAFLTWCLQQDYLQHNPLASRRQPNKANSRDRLLSDLEVSQIWRESFNHGNYGTLLRALLLSGQRYNQFASLDPSWVSADTITWPPHMMKSGLEHSIPLLPLLKANLPIGPVRNGTTAIVRVRAAINMPPWTPHDARRFLSSTMSKLGIPIDITEAILAHMSGSRSQIQRTYDRDKRLPQMRDALTKYEAHLKQILGQAFRTLDKRL
jgi:hypothetical protein